MVTVLLLDVNDNPPIVLFPQSNQSYMLVLPNTLPGTSITEVYAVDKDTGMNAVIAYSIIKRKGGEPASFAIDPATGNITLKRELSNRGLYSLLVKVTDHGQPEPLYSTVMVNFFVNETVSNESYIQSLLTREADIEVEERPWYIGQMTEGPERLIGQVTYSSSKIKSGAQIDHCIFPQSEMKQLNIKRLRACAVVVITCIGQSW
ncbi:hypothetical protein L3Q82_000196 [Scortum barcoo]|uniref:Uncharacterized protein n=1 Tax=Scortum barcoo TaxID=214431 RepID=A0ACB8XBQ2_9TELE|nr:hypothetical protein L3Q82_000196 [Scortum barcoo]